MKRIFLISLFLLPPTLFADPVGFPESTGAVEFGWDSAYVLEARDMLENQSLWSATLDAQIGGLTISPW